VQEACGIRPLGADYAKVGKSGNTIENDSSHR
jgi:hypothetical protein